MKIEHIALWTTDREVLCDFYQKYFNGVPGKKYKNTQKQFESCFLKFNTGTRLEIMQKTGIDTVINDEHIGFAHFAVSVGSKEKVIELTELLQLDGYQVVGEPRETGDGYFESCILDPDNNRIEITI